MPILSEVKTRQNAHLSLGRRTIQYVIGFQIGKKYTENGLQTKAFEMGDLVDVYNLLRKDVRIKIRLVNLLVIYLRQWGLTSGIYES